MSKWVSKDEALKKNDALLRLSGTLAIRKSGQN